MSKARVLTKDEITRVFKIIQTTRFPTRDAAAFALSIFAGMRCKEICLLTLRDVRSLDPIAAVDIIHLTKHQTKGKKFSRRVFISDDLKKILNAHLKTVQKLPDTDPFIRSTQTSGHFCTITLSSRMKRIYRSAGIIASSHSGRRSFATALNAIGIGAKTIMTAMGHKSLQSTQEYIEVTDLQLMNAVNAI